MLDKNRTIVLSGRIQQEVNVPDEINVSVGWVQLANRTIGKKGRKESGEKRGEREKCLPMTGSVGKMKSKGTRKRAEGIKGLKKMKNNGIGRRRKRGITERVAPGSG